VINGTEVKGQIYRNCHHIYTQDGDLIICRTLLVDHGDRTSKGVKMGIRPYDEIQEIIARGFWAFVKQYKEPSKIVPPTNAKIHTIHNGDSGDIN
jgi:hypothetical protein